MKMKLRRSNITPVNRARWLLAVFVSMLLLQSCFSIKTWFNWLDTYLKWQIDDLFDITSEQETFVSKRLKDLLAIYKANEVPKYIVFLKETKTRLEREVRAEDVNWFYQSIREFNTTIATILSEDAAEFLSGVSSDQIVHLQKQLAESNESWMEKYGFKDEQSLQDRQKRIYERVEEWVGKLTEEQRKKIDQLYQPNLEEIALRYQHRLESQQRFIELLTFRSNKSELKAALLDWYLNSEQHYSKQHRQQNQKRLERTTRLVLMLDKTATRKQRTHINTKLDDYIAQLESVLND